MEKILFSGQLHLFRDPTAYVNSWRYDDILW